MLSRNLAKQSPPLGHNTMQDAYNQEVRIGTDRVRASTVGPKVATPCQAQLHAEHMFCMVEPNAATSC